MSHRSIAIALSAIMVASLFAGGTVAISSTLGQAETTAPTEISSCTTIDSSGHYALTQDVVRSEGSEDACIEIRASDVTLEGNGHVIDGNGSEGAGIAVTATQPVHNVSVTNLTARDNWNNIRFEGVTDGQITNVSSLDSERSGIVIRQSRQIDVGDSDLEGSFTSHGVEVVDSEGLSIVSNTFSDGINSVSASGMIRSEISDNVMRDSYRAIDLDSGSGNVISNNTIPVERDYAIRVRGHNNTLVGNTITGGYDPVTLSGSNHTFASNDVSGAINFAVSARGVNHTFRNNSLSGGDSGGGSGGALEISGSEHVIANNFLTGVHGVHVTSAAGPISIDDNHIRAVRHIEVAESSLCPDPGEVVTAHGNVFDADSYEAYERYGVLNHDDDTVNATNNYWGASDGPSSPDGENVTDPVTGEPADGSGLPVSEGVHFDPWLEAPPENAGAENGTDD